MYQLHSWFWLASVSVVLCHDCPNMPFTVRFTSIGAPKWQVHFSTMVQQVEIAALKEGLVTNKYKLDESILNDPTKTKVNHDPNGDAFYVTSINDFTVGFNEHYVTCLNMKVIQNGNRTTCRICKLSTACVKCPPQYYTLNTRTFNDGSGQIEVTTAQLPIPLKVECLITSKTDETPYSYYSAMNTPGPYTVTNQYSYNNKTTQCPINPNAFTTPKTTLFPYAITMIPLYNLRSNHGYEVQPKFEVDWQGKAPFGWPDPLPLVADPMEKRPFTVSSECPPW